jgi:hypothetical protein
MKIELNISLPLSSLTHAQQSKIRRVATVLREEGFKVEIKAPVEIEKLPEDMPSKV